MDPEQSVDQLLKLESAIIDASSIIYADGAGFLPPLAAFLSLSTVTGVRAEVGQELGGITIIDPAEGAISGSGSGSVDQQVVAAAARLGLAVISDDKKLLAEAADAGCDYFNAIMMLELLLLRQSISHAAYDAFRSRLLDIARYSRHVLLYSDEVHWEVRKRIG